MTIDDYTFAQIAHSLTKCPLGWNSNFVHTRLARRRLDLRDRLAKEPPIVSEVDEQIGLDRNDEVAITLFNVIARAREHAQTMHRERERVTLVAAKRQKCTETRQCRIAGRIALGVDRHAFRELLLAADAKFQVGGHESGRAEVDDH